MKEGWDLSSSEAEGGAANRQHSRTHCEALSWQQGSISFDGVLHQ